MTGLIGADDAADLLSDFGVAVTLRRIGSPNVDVPCQAVITSVLDQVISGGVTQFRRRVTIGSTEIAAANWPSPPQKGDQIIWQSRTMTVQDVRTAGVADEIVTYQMTTLGS